MRRADRLFRIVEYLKARRQIVTADTLAIELGVSTRTIYRDISDLLTSGVPIIGEAGMGYVMDRDHVIRPLMFTTEELEALTLGAQMVKSWGDDALAGAASQAIDKVSAVLPEALQQEMSDISLLSFTSSSAPAITIDFTALRRAIRSKYIINFEYVRQDGTTSSRHARPLSLAFFAPVWLLIGWCELRNDFRNFRIDRIGELTVTTNCFKDEKGKRLMDYKCIMQNS